MSKILAVSLIASLLSLQSFAQVRQVTVKMDDILTIKTALGIATIIQFPDTIQSAIIGDQSGFRVEYLDKAATVKPLRYSAKTNLYIVTEKRRYNTRLNTLSQDVADYVVYVKNPDPVPITTKWTKFGKATDVNDVRLSITKIGLSERGFILLEASLSVKNSKPYTVKPEVVWIKQNNEMKVINGLFISSTKLTKEKPILIGISLAKSDLTPKKPITLEVQMEKTLTLTVPESVLWK